MKIIKYQLFTEVNLGTEDTPNVHQTLSAVEMPYTEANYQLALSEAYQGQVTVEDDDRPEPLPSAEARLAALEAAMLTMMEG